MVTISVNEGTLVIEVQGMDKLWSFRSRLDIPLVHITGASQAPDEAKGWFDGLRLMGTHLPGVISAGTFYEDGGLVFWDVHDTSRAIAIALEHERYQKLVVEVEDPSATLALIHDAVRSVKR